MNRLEETSGLLAECLEELNESLVEMTAVFRVKRRVLAAADIEALSDVLEREGEVAERLFNTESRREVLAEELTEMTGAPDGTLAEIVERLPEGPARVLQDTGIRLETTVNVLVREARIVAAVCNAAVEHYERLIRIVAGAEIDSGTYTERGRQSTGATHRLLDQAI